MGVSVISIDRAQFCDKNDISIVVLTKFSATVASRKRKLRQLYHVAKTEDGVPDIDLTDPDANLHSSDEIKFLNESDILLYVLRLR